MSKLKALMLGFLILVPIFVFIFIYTFGEHHFGLRGYFPEVDEKGEVRFDAKGDTIFQQLPAFSLTDQSGNTFGSEDLEGKYTLVNFFHSDCSDICAKMNAHLVRVQESYQNNEQVQLVTITSKPDTDSVNVLRKYATTFKADTAKWHFLTGDKTTIYSLAQQGFQVPLQKTGGPEDFLMTDKFFLVDNKLRVRGIYNGTEVSEIDRMIIEVNVLLDGQSKSK